MLNTSGNADSGFEATAPVRVLHLADTLASGGCERLIWDTVRLSDRRRVSHRVVIFFPDGYFGPFVYAERLRRMGAYGRPLHTVKSAPEAPNSEPVFQSNAPPNQPDTTTNRELSLFRRVLKKIPRRWKRAVGETWHRFSTAVGRAWKKTFLYLSASGRLLAECIRFRPHVIHVHGYHYFKFVPLLKLILRKPIVHSVPATFSQMIDQNTGWLPDLYKKFHSRVDRFFLAHAYRPELLGVGVPEQKLLSLQSAIDVQEIARLASDGEHHRREIRARLGISEDDLIALSVGRLHPSKGHQYALEALPALVEQFPNLHWVVLGEGEQHAELEARAEQLGMVRHAHLVGYLEDILPFYVAADIFLRTMVLEGDNLSSCAAAAAGLPVVGFETGNATDLISKVGHGALVRNRDANALAAAAREILLLPDRGRALGRRGAEYCQAHLDIRHEVDNFIATYTELYLRTRRAGATRGGVALSQKCEDTARQQR